MNKKITIYELLGLIKDGQAPLEFKVNDEIYEYDEDRGYICRHIGGWTYLYENLNKGYISLNDEVEIIEDIPISKLYINNELKYDLTGEKKIPEKIKIEQDTPSSNYYIRNENGTKCGLTKHSKMIVETLNQVIDYLKSKGDE